MDFDADITALEAFRDGLPPFFGLDAVRAADPSDALIEAAFRAMRHAFTATPPPRYDARVDAAIQLGALILGARGGQGPRVFEQVALRVAHPAAHKELAPLLRTILADELVPPLLGALDSDDPHTAAMALSLARWAFFGRWAAPLTAGEAKLVNVAVDLRRARSVEAPALRAELAAWIPLVPNR